MNDSIERDLILDFKKLKEKKENLDEALKAAKEEFDRSEAKLIDYLESKSATATAKYEGLGYAMIPKPRVFATCSQDKMEPLTEFLKTVERLDLIKETVNSQSLSSFVSEAIENGIQIPECISYYLKTSIRLYK